MILKISDEYISVQEIDIEQAIKLWDDISTINGDFSYSFQVPNTAKHKSILLADVTSKLNCSLQFDNGIEYLSGFLKVQEVTDEQISLSFFSGNSDIFEILKTPIRELRLKQFDTDITSSNIVSSWDKSFGIVFPFVNRGGLSTRKSYTYSIGDFQPFIFIKDAFNLLANMHGVKLRGDLFNDPLFNLAITTNNQSKSTSTRAVNQTVYIGKNTTQTFPDTVENTVEFNNLEGIYYNSPLSNWEAAQYRYVFSENVIQFDVFIKLNISVDPTLFNSAGKFTTRIYYNSTLVHEQINSYSPGLGSVQVSVSSTEFNKIKFSGASGGGFVTIKCRWDAFSPTNSYVLSGELKITPTKFFKVFAEELLPDISVIDFFSDVFRVFNVFCSFDSKTYTLTCDKIETILDREAVDLSPFVNVDSINFEEFLSSYNKRNLLKYELQSLDAVTIYGNKNELEWGAGVIPIDNDFLTEEGNLIEVEFIAAFQNIVPNLGSLPQLEYVEMVETDNSRDVTSVSDNGDGLARFNWSSGGAIGVVMVRVSDSTIEEYNGDYIVTVNTAGYAILQDVFFVGTATCILTEITWEEQDNEDQVLLVFVKNTLLLDWATRQSIIGPDLQSYSSAAFAYFAYPDSANVFSSRKFQSLSFGPIPGCSQPSLINMYWGNASKILNNGDLVRVTAYLPDSLVLDLLRPVKVVTDKINSLFLLNRITGRNGSHLPCELELIKIR